MNRYPLCVGYVLARTQLKQLHTDKINLQKYSFLYARWEATYFYWELVFISRRTIFCLIALLSSYPLLQAVIAQMVVGLAWALQYAAPHSSPTIGRTCLLAECAQVKNAGQQT